MSYAPAAARTPTVIEAEEPGSSSRGEANKISDKVVMGGAMEGKEWPIDVDSIWDCFYLRSDRLVEDSRPYRLPNQESSHLYWTI